jgi:hypothetical protein
MFDLINFLNSLTGADKIISDLQIKLNNSLSDNRKLENNINSILQSNETNLSKLRLLEEIIDANSEEKKLEEYLTNKIPKENRYYLRYETDGEYSIDVRNFFMVNDSRIPVVYGPTNDVKALESLRWVRKNIIYTPDDSSSTYKKSEYWAYPYQTLRHKKGDCEDGAIVIANIMVKSGIPYYRVRICAGSVNGGGHAYCVYCRETDNEWVVMDWCYWANDLTVDKRKTHKQEQNYFDNERNFYVWFSWDLKNCYAKETLAVLSKNSDVLDYFVDRA